MLGGRIGGCLGLGRDTDDYIIFAIVVLRRHEDGDMDPCCYSWVVGDDGESRPSTSDYV